MHRQQEGDSSLKASAVQAATQASRAISDGARQLQQTVEDKKQDSQRKHEDQVLREDRERQQPRAEPLMVCLAREV